jgi:hypothetical protein
VCKIGRKVSSRNEAEKTFATAFASQSVARRSVKRILVNFPSEPPTTSNSENRSKGIHLICCSVAQEQSAVAVIVDLSRIVFA